MAGGIESTWTLAKNFVWDFWNHLGRRTDFEPIEAKDVPNKHRIPWDIEKVAEALNKERKVIFALSTEGRISEDNVDTSIMVLSAKGARWDKVFTILEKKPYIINAIPQERAWFALHQSVFQNDINVIRKLLALKTCDTQIKAKRDQNNLGKAGMTPYQLAKKYSLSCKFLLPDHATQNTQTLEVTLISADEGQTFLKAGVPYFDLASSFLRQDILNSLHLENGGFLHITEKLYQLMEKDWKYVQNAVRVCLYPFNKMVADRLQEATLSDKLKEAMIWIYTCNKVYIQVNAALRRASKTEFPVSDDLLLSLYSLFLTSILLHWKNWRAYRRQRTED